MRLFKEEKEFVESEISKLVNKAINKKQMEDIAIEAFKTSKAYTKILNSLAELGFKNPIIYLGFRSVSVEAKDEGKSFRFSLEVKDLTNMYGSYYNIFNIDDKKSTLLQKYLETKTPLDEDRYKTLTGIVAEMSDKFTKEIKDEHANNIIILRELK